MDTNLCETVLRDMLTKNGFNFDRPDDILAWETFKEFSKIKFENTEEFLEDRNPYLMTGAYVENSHEPKYYVWRITRELGIIADEDGFIADEQIILEMKYLVNETLINIDIGDACDNSSRFENFEDFFKLMEEEDPFKIPFSKFTPISCHIEYIG